MYRKYSIKGGVEWQIQHKAELSTVFVMDLIWSTVFFSTSRVSHALADLMFCVGGLAVAMNLERDSYKQIEAIVSDPLLPQ